MTSLLARLRAARLGDSRDAGFTVLEVLVAVVVFVIIATTGAIGILNAMKATHETQQRVDAADVAQQVIATVIRNAETTNEIPAPGEHFPAHVGGKNLSGQQFASDEAFTYVETVVQAGGSCSTGTYFTVNVKVYLGSDLDASGQPTGQFLARSDARVACPRV